MDDTVDTMSIDPHLSYPSTIEEPIPEASSSSQTPRTVLHDRLYIGNLHPAVDESVTQPPNVSLLIAVPYRYSLLQVFSKFGKVVKLDFLFHKSGPQKGKPRGYAFVEYSNGDVRPSKFIARP